MKNVENKPEKVLLVRGSSTLMQKVKHPFHCLPPYTLKYIEALLMRENNCQSRLIDCMVYPVNIDMLVAQTLAWSPGIIVISANILNLKEARHYASLVKKQNDIFIILVGHFGASDFAEHLLSENNFDVIILGEAECEITSLIQRLLHSESTRDDEIRRYKLRQRGGREPFVVDDLDGLPFPVYTPQQLQEYNFLYPLKINKRVTWGHIISSRGCPGSCIFCSPVTRISYGKKLRSRSAGNIVEELAYLKKLGANIISFDDDDFTISREHVKAICREIQKRNLNIHWIAHARVDNMTFDLLKIMKEAGCIFLRFGIESGSERIIKVLGKTSSDIDWIQKSKEVFRDAQRLGIVTYALFIIGSPTESREEVEESLRLAKELAPDLIQVHFFTPYPGSVSYRQLKSDIKDKSLFAMYHYDVSVDNVSNIDSETLSKIQVDFYRNFFFRPNFLLRHFCKYIVFYFFNRKIFLRLFKVLDFLKA